MIGDQFHFMARDGRFAGRLHRLPTAHDCHSFLNDDDDEDVLHFGGVDGAKEWLRPNISVGHALDRRHLQG